MTCARGCCDTQAEHYRSVGLLGPNVGRSRVAVNREESATTITTEHWDGRVDAAVRPDTVRYGARTHRTGRKKGEVAEVTEMTTGKRKERYGQAR